MASPLSILSLLALNRPKIELDRRRPLGLSRSDEESLRLRILRGCGLSRIVVFIVDSSRGFNLLNDVSDGTRSGRGTVMRPFAISAEVVPSRMDIRIGLRSLEGEAAGGRDCGRDADFGVPFWRRVGFKGTTRGIVVPVVVIGARVSF